MTRAAYTTPAGRLAVLTVIAALLGVAGGGAAWLLLHLIGLITDLALFGRLGWQSPPVADLVTGPRIMVVALLGALVVTLLARWAPAIRGHGIPEAMEAVLTKQSRIHPSTAVAKPLSAAVAIGTGAPFGAEGPIIVTGGSLGSLLGQVLRVSPSERKILLASGAAAGMAAVFGAPLAAVVLAIELLLFELSTRAFVPLVVAAGVAGAMHAALFGSGPLFHVPPHEYAGLAVLPAFVVLGLLAGLLAVLINRGLFTAEAWYRRLPIGELWHPLVGAALFASIGLAVPRVLGVGYAEIDAVLANRLAVGTLAVLVVAKLLAWWAALASGTSGGTLAPILLVSAGFGSLFGTAAHAAVPSLGIGPGAFAVVAMAATFGAATRATFTAMVFVFELTRDYRVMFPLMVATVVADLVAGALMQDSIMTEKLTRRGLRVHNDYEVDPFRTAPVHEIMSTPVITLPESTTLGEARSMIASGPHSAYPIVDPAHRCIGIVTRDDVMRAAGPDEQPALAHASADVVTVEPDDLAITVLERMLTEQVDHIPVVVDHRLVGICTRTDLLRARSRQLEAERHQDGWGGYRAWRPWRTPRGEDGEHRDDRENGANGENGENGERGDAHDPQDGRRGRWHRRRTTRPGVDDRAGA